ncbi:MAG TPA: hypothetical protein VFB32_06195 [Rudaea sp.]|nr:hypothetical protein [Rudaea sp.]
MADTEEPQPHAPAGLPAVVPATDAQFAHPPAHPSHGRFAPVPRDYAAEVPISSPPGAHEPMVVVAALAFMAMGVGLDLIGHGADLHFGALLSITLGVPAIVYVRSFFRDFVDEVRAGPDYIVARRGRASVALRLEQISRVRRDRLSRDGPMRYVLTLSFPCAFGRRIAFHPREPFPATHVTQVLKHRALD